MIFEAVNISALKYFNRLGLSSVQMLEPDKGCAFLEDVTAFIPLKGLIEGGLILTVSEQLACFLAKRFLIGDVTEEEAAGCAIEVIAEMTNVIAGNALMDRENHDILLGTPVMGVTRKAAIRSHCKAVCIQPYSTPYGRLQCIYIGADRKAELAGLLTIHS
ncbi:chemotaxis protein CheX [Paenibacillus hamazuiensis]|uniref:chemotaxis protein CheX n=1 Tax=Paenibacillus hamazuiensis TaxID=2936508 RepID=UPI00200D11F3|nr:chemotaxis protein CheX [Paenibacillus hamazuiensis]